ncbi:S-adenosylmethionine:tRNA ribosyltransferase-isomerase [Segetibacter aerophilus]|uniref:S-adenosylmethionine:tRNA ribosyltransferase-isomerase n=1 Tax=Segetibacter aerophilus TaxID=670293 RepID=A0A512BE89_9BACT|nr:S-adenosylmethionine:tRNA ribosyltransferase-isomerase [Segetibacter aerophilus]
MGIREAGTNEFVQKIREINKPLFLKILATMHPKHLSITEFSYDLDPERIAKYPLEERDASKLLVYKSGTVTTSTYKQVAEFLPEETLLIFNNTKVVEARLLFQKPTGGVIEIFCLEPGDQYKDITSAMLQKGKASWKCLVGGASKWKHGMKLQKQVNENGVNFILEASIAGRLPDCFIIDLSWKPEEVSFAEILHIAGFIPLPPYLHRSAEEDDKNRYQTIYAKQDGSVAAPTAGLHFTDEVFERLAAKNIRHDFVTLHVGAGTFKPVKAETMDEHEMHAEFIEVAAEAVERLINYVDKTVVAVGTTSLRTIESLYWMGVKVLHEPAIEVDDIVISQWDPYELEHFGIEVKDALKALFYWMIKKGLNKIITKTQILIAPGYQLKIAKGIITNFHQPQSTLLLLVAAIVGEEWKRIYQYAMDNDFRFLSYGDGCLLWNDSK